MSDYRSDTAVPGNGQAQFVIFINDKPFSVSHHYAGVHGVKLPSTPTMNILELAGAGGMSGMGPTYRKDGSQTTTDLSVCVVETNERGEWIGPVYTTLKEPLRSLALSPAQRFAVFPDGTY